MKTCAEAKIKPAEYEAAEALLTAIDDLTEALNGDRKTLHTKPHGGSRG